jgi:hypothetical protein
MSPTAPNPYEALASLIERELELVAERDFEGLAELKHQRGALERTLPATPPPSARDALQRCHALHQRVRVELLRVREAILIELGQVRHGQRAAAGYAPARNRVLRIDASA